MSGAFSGNVRYHSSVERHKSRSARLTADRDNAINPNHMLDQH